MIPKKINDLQEIETIIEKYKRPGMLSNNYLLGQELESLVTDGKLFYCGGDKNLFLLVEKPKCFRVYYQINDTSESISIDTDKHLMLEILFRGASYYPEIEEKYWIENGFRVNLVRDLYENSFKNINISESSNKNYEIKIATGQEDGLFAMQLFNSIFDPYSGDYLTKDDADNLVNGGLLLIAIQEGKRIGALNFYKKNNKFWLGHVAVEIASQGNNVGKNLVREYILRNQENSNTRYALWVQSQNTRAIEMYKNFGLKYINKSTLSMIK